MTTTVTIAPVRKSIRVSASPAHAFDVFTSGLGRWWPLDHGIGKTPRKAMVMETRLGGYWYELAQDGSRTDIGKITVWEPPNRFVMTWDRGLERDARRARTSQIRADGRRSGREDAQGRRRRLARPAGTVQATCRGRVIDLARQNFLRAANLMSQQ
jgi:hypothetical protein